MTPSPAAALRDQLASGELIVAPGVFDGISAAAVDAYGFSAAYMTGAGVSASGFGLPDVGLVSLTEMVDRARMLTGRLRVPLIADADTGYGSPLNVARTVQEYERAGVAAIQLEDQTFPKRCGHLAGKEVIAAEAFAESVRAACEARTDPDTVIVARTDARAPLGLDAAIERAHRYREAGADVLFVEAPRSEAEIARVAAELDGPLLLNLVPGGHTPLLPPERIGELGFAIAIYPAVLLMSLAQAALEALAPLRPGVAAPPRVDGIEDFFDLLGLEAWAERGARYAHPAPAVSR